MSIWASALQSALPSSHPSSSNSSLNSTATQNARIQEEAHQFKALWTSAFPIDPSYSRIPPFYVKKNTENGLLPELDATALDLFREYRQSQILTQEEIEYLWTVINENNKPQSTVKISYSRFCEIASSLPEKFDSYFKSSVFTRLIQDENSCVQGNQFISYVMRRVSLLQARITFSFYDADGSGYIYEADLNRYVTDMIPAYPQLKKLEESFYKYYTCIAVRKFMFFLDPMRRGKIKIKDILLSPILTEFFELREEMLPMDLARTNWFSPLSTSRIYGQYVTLDKDRNGMISRAELAKYNRSSYTDAFLDRIFQEYQSYDGELDFKCFLDLVLALENLNTTQGITYCFKLLDINCAGYLDEFCVHWFLKDTFKKLSQNGEMFQFDDIMNEIYDMSRPQKHPRRLYLSDLISCGVGGTIVSILIDVNGLVTYDSSLAGG
ncbi:hypothetical protein BKA69DRAFT_356760 [Paraphysoderma sedebokerense]|nr:hypothetical protein BKA69DRAFT_356760 [Paraphysoderma sedebokerense]